jgi:hypothetical protein
MDCWTDEMLDHADTLVVCSCDHNYFPLAKGLILSILDKGRLPGEIGLALIDIGCETADIDWLNDAGVKVRAADSGIIGRLAAPEFGYQRSQVCRPFLPKIFPEADILIWIDCDAWIQDTSILPYLRTAVLRSGEKLFITPEWHYSYAKINQNVLQRHEEMYSYYAPTFGATIAADMCRRPTLNSGFFAMRAGNPLWHEWEIAVTRLYLQEYARYEQRVRHMAEQIALNVIAARTSDVMLVDPLYNYICLWTPPYRDSDDVVRIALPPHLPVGVIHLAGGWKDLGKMYFDKGLLYKRGSYLTEVDMGTLFPAERKPGVR